MKIHNWRVLSFYSNGKTCLQKWGCKRCNATVTLPLSEKPKKSKCKEIDNYAMQKLRTVLGGSGNKRKNRKRN